MQAEVISALIGAGVGAPAAVVAYVVGRRQALATLTAAQVQIDGSRKQWRDDSRRPAWLAFVRSTDGVNDSIERLIRRQVAPSLILQELLPDANRKLKEVELEGPPEIYEFARKFFSNVNACLILAAMVGPYIASQDKFDYALAEARCDVALQGSGSERLACVIRAHEALQALAAERGRMFCADPPVEMVQLCDVIFGPLVQRASSVNAGLGESIAKITQGFGEATASMMSAAPVATLDAMRKVQECDGFSEKDAAALVFIFGTGGLPVLRRILDGQTEVTRQLRRDFLNATDGYLDGRLPVPRGE